MKSVLTSYGDLVNKAIELNKKLDEHSIWPKNKSGRFQAYIKTVNALDNALKQGKVDEYLATHNKNGQIMFILKQLHELTSILSSTLELLTDKNTEETKLLREKLKSSLAGTVYPQDENINNNSARNNQFELLVLSRLLLSGFKDFKMLVNPDILININGNRYPLECKRIFSQSSKAIIDAVNNASDQIVKNWNNDFLTGVIAIDLSTKYEQGNNILDGVNYNSAHEFVQQHLEQDFEFIYHNCPKLKKLAEKGMFVSLLLNVSCVYALRNHNELGWMNELSLGVYTKENHYISSIFLKDFVKLGQPQMEL